MSGLSSLAYGHDSKGGFYVIDHVARRAIYALPGSALAVLADSDSEKAIVEMLAQEDPIRWSILREAYYLGMCKLYGVDVPEKVE